MLMIWTCLYSFPVARTSDSDLCAPTTRESGRGSLRITGSKAAWPNGTSNQPTHASGSRRLTSMSHYQV